MPILWNVDFYCEIPCGEAVAETAGKYRAAEEEARGAACRFRAGSARTAARLMCEIAEGMREIRAVFTAMLCKRFRGAKTLRLLLAEKNRNIHTVRQAYVRLTGLVPPPCEPRKPFTSDFCCCLKQAFLEQSFVIARIAELGKAMAGSPEKGALQALGASELSCLFEIDRLYLPLSKTPGGR